MKPFHVYMLLCADDSYYVGHTDDLEKRMAEHHEGTHGGYTSVRRPVRLVWCQDMTTRDEAIGSERTLKGWTRAKKEALIRGDWDAIHTLARGKDWTERPGVENPNAVRPSTTRRPVDTVGGGPGATLRTNGPSNEGPGATLRTNGPSSVGPPEAGRSRRTNGNA